MYGSRTELDPIAVRVLPAALDEFAARRDRVALQQLLDAAVEVWGALGAAVGEWHGPGEPHVFASAGELVKTTDKLAICDFLVNAGRSASGCAVEVLDVGIRYFCAALARQHRPLLVLVTFFAAGTPLPDSGAALRILELLHEAREELAAQSQAVDTTPAVYPIPPYHVAGRSRAMTQLYRDIYAAARSDLPVLVTGETGSGKEHVARMLHEWSRRGSGPFVAINCSAIPDDLLESELFGIGRGVASGVQERIGRFREAHGGTIFLDEIAEMPLLLQPKILRVLQDRQLVPLGEKPRPISVRIVAATNADLLDRSGTGSFRSDLYYRVAGHILRVPPLRERRSDIRDLVAHVIGTVARQNRRTPPVLTLNALELLLEYDWPGNVRELENEVGALVQRVPEGCVITSEHLSVRVHQRVPSRRPIAAPDDNLNIRDRTIDLERELIRRALQRAQGNQSLAARLLGISRNGLSIRMRRLRIEQVSS